MRMGIALLILALFIIGVVWWSMNAPETGDVENMEEDDE